MTINNLILDNIINTLKTKHCLLIGKTIGIVHTLFHYAVLQKRKVFPLTRTKNSLFSNIVF